MPWPPKQQRAIFLRIKREKGEAAAKRFMHQHGHGDKETNDTDRSKRARAARRRAR